jgi:plastocyanin
MKFINKVQHPLYPTFKNVPTMMNRKMVVMSAIIGTIVVTGVALAATRAGGTNMLSYAATYKAPGQTSNPGQTSKQVNVEIVKGASTMGNKAFSPNPIQIQPGTTVVWKNDDSTSHTVTSGKGMSDTNKGKVFDSKPIAAGKTYSHKFDTAGTFDYFDTLHPKIVGAVVVK